MSAEIGAIAGYLMAIAMMIIAFFAWRKAVSLHHLLVEAANRFEVARRQNQDLEHDVQRITEKLHQAKESCRRYERTAEELRQKQELHGSEVEHLTLKNQRQQADLQRREEHLVAQVNAMTEQLSEARHEQHLTAQKLNQLEADLASKQQAANRVWQEKLSILQEQAATLQKDYDKARQQLQHLEKQLQVADPLTVKRLKRKIANLEHLLSSTRGLRELAEERNENWEVALRHLSHWILQEKGVKMAADATIGKLVGTALEKIQAQLIDDEHLIASGKDWHTGHTSSHDSEQAVITDVRQPASASASLSAT